MQEKEKEQDSKMEFCSLLFIAGKCTVPYDNAMAEDFFSILKTAYIYRHKPKTFKEANALIAALLFCELTHNASGRIFAGLFRLLPQLNA